MKAALRCVLLLLAASLAGSAAEFHTPVSITSPNTTAYYPLARLFQGPGVGYSATVPHDAITGAAQTWVTTQPNGSGDFYANNQPAPILRIDLGEDRALREISTWGYAETTTNGVRTFDLRFATAAEGPSGFGNSIPNQTGFTANMSATARHSHPLVPVMARYVEFTATDNWRGLAGSTPGGDRVGLGEIAFENTGPITDPRLEVPAAVGLDLDGSVQTFALSVHNAGLTQALDVTSATFGGPQGAAFTILSAPASVAPGATAMIEFAFHPSGVAGSVAATLVLATNDPLAPTTSIALSGFLHDPKLVVAPTLDFGLVAPGSAPSSLPLALANTGPGHPLVLGAPTLGGTDAARFSVVSAPSTIDPSNQGQIWVSFDPSGVSGEVAAQLTLPTNDAANPVTIINLKARVALIEAGSSLRINEFLASNSSGLADGDGNRSDWIEIFNSGAAPVDLAGWHLTDKASNLTKWTFPARVLGPGQYLVVFASGQASDHYVDAAGNLHTNFNLSASGEYLALVKPDGSTIASEYHPAFPVQFGDVSHGVLQNTGSTTDLIASATPALLVPPDDTLGLTWTQRGFSPGAGWFNGSGLGIGYDTATDYLPSITTDVKSVLYTAGRPGIYIRIPFTIPDKAAVTALSLSIRYDDGFVAYLNGVEIATRNAPATPLWNSTAVASPSPEPASETIDVTAFVSALENGDNILAIHGLNSASNSSDFLISPQWLVTTAGPPSTATGYLSVPTPGAPNAAAALPGPRISEVTPTPLQPAAAQQTAITARVEARLAPVASVTLLYRVMYGAESSLPMTDTGAGGDAVAGDGVFTAIIPAAAHTAGTMLRWRVSAADASSNLSTAPAHLDTTGEGQSAEYFGTLIPDPAVVSALPVFHWFTQNVSASHTRSGTRASVSFAGRFYDNVFVRQRGGATNATSSQKFDFNKGDSLFIDATMPSVGEINLNGPGSDSTSVRQTLAFDTYRLAGNAACQSALWWMRVNGASDRVGVFVEQVDEDFLVRNGYDPTGDLYKMTGRTDLNPAFYDTLSGVEKKTGDPTDLSSLQALVAGLSLPTSTERRRFVIDHLDLPQIVNDLALRSLTQDADDVRKNFYVYQDTGGDALWRIFPWDKDWTFGITGDGGTWLPHPFFGDEEHAKQNANQWNILYDVLFEETTTQRLYLRRLRTLMDTLLQPASTPPAQRLLENRASAIIAPASPLLSTNVSSITSYLDNRRTVLFNNYPDLIPSAPPVHPALAITGAEPSPASGDQDQEYIVLANPESTEIDLSGWSLTGGVEFVFAPGTVIERGGNLYVSPAPRAFRQRSVSPTGGEERLVVGPYSGHLSNLGESISLLDASGAVASTYTIPAAPTDAQRFLVVSEILYHPRPDGEAEFIELLNISPTITLDLSGVSFTSGIRFTFASGTSLPPGARVVIAKNTSAFQTVHGTSIPLAGQFSDGTSLANEGEKLKLEDADGNTILEFSYDDAPPWPDAPAQSGASLVLVAPFLHPDPSDPCQWRASQAPAGNPSAADSTAFAGDPRADSDHDGLCDLLDYAIGAGSPPTVWRDVAGQAHVRLDRSATSEADLRVEFCTDLAAASWQPLGADVLLSRDNPIPGVERLVFTIPVPPGPQRPRLFIRARASVP